MDHAFGNKFFPHAQIWAHAFDAPALRSPEQFKAYTGFPGTQDYFDKMNFSGGPLGRDVDRELVDGEVLDFGEGLY
ncbi:hypothetical protein DSOL_2855 [Desulfosporosinus metallidurans]|uniref:Uncharacterized protein n=1 Tax=Desulfosporosinus metallidurans TaxID=1888891 RepID=A0A1Q8QUQ9_9FIRM|nr:hypothetical protein DSOL_2855 [Desulfosporosinus metallidurans]